VKHYWQDALLAYALDGAIIVAVGVGVWLALGGGDALWVGW